MRGTGGIRGGDYKLKPYKRNAHTARIYTFAGNANLVIIITVNGHHFRKLEGALFYTIFHHWNLSFHLRKIYEYEPVGLMKNLAEIWSISIPSPVLQEMFDLKKTHLLKVSAFI